AFLGHDNQIRLGYQYHLAGQAWGPYTPLSALSDGTLDGSASVRWDPFHDNDPGVIDGSFFDEDRLDNGQYLAQLYYVAVIPAGTPSGGGDTSPPTVALTAPAAGATASRVTTVSASASDDVRVAGRQL